MTFSGWYGCLTYNWFIYLWYLLSLIYYFTIYHCYSQELTSQAAKILGSVDFLGNPLGLFFDVTEGISGLLQEGNVGGLIKNVTHGVSNSAAKVRSVE